MSVLKRQGDFENQNLQNSFKAITSFFIMMIKKKDFVEIEFTGRIKDSGEVFDTTKKEIAEKSGLNIKELKPFILCVKSKMLPKGFDDELEGKEFNKNYVLELEPKEAFGNREKNLIKMIPTKLFLEQKINPQRGMQLSLDGQIVRILSNSGGRTLVDFNNPLAGKKIVYEYKVLREITDEKEKVNALQDFLFRKRHDFEIKEKKIIFKIEKNLESFVKMFAPKFKEILGKEIETKIK